MNREYVYHAFTKTLCSKCSQLVDGKIIYSDKGVFILKFCPDCGEHYEILEEDYQYHLQKYKYDKPGTKSGVQTKYNKGCPYDCGLCENHDQHTCIGLIEITGRCNLGCPMCYANGSDANANSDGSGIDIANGGGANANSGGGGIDIANGISDTNGGGDINSDVNTNSDGSGIDIANDGGANADSGGGGIDIANGISETNGDGDINSDGVDTVNANGISDTNGRGDTNGGDDINGVDTVNANGISTASVGDLPLRDIEKMMDFYMESEAGSAEILQISGGEPTLHKDVLAIIDMAKCKGFKYVMLNTNGIRLAEDEAFVRELSKFRGGFEVYLQFDGLDDKAYAKLRGKNLADTKKHAIENLKKYNIPTTLVATIESGVNDNLCGEILVFGMNTACVRGVNYQPVSYYGGVSAPMERVTLSGILNRIEKQTGKMIRTSDFIPLPCNVERVAITYLFKDKKGFIPITRDRDLSEFKDFIGNTFVFTVEDTLKNFNDDSRIFNVCACCDLISDIKKYIPKNFTFKSKEEKMKFVDENTFRISVSSFVDQYNFDMKSMQKECVHIITPDLKRIPFSAYNMLHRKRRRVL